MYEQLLGGEEDGDDGNDGEDEHDENYDNDKDKDEDGSNSSSDDENDKDGDDPRDPRDAPRDNLNRTKDHSHHPPPRLESSMSTHSTPSEVKLAKSRRSFQGGELEGIKEDLSRLLLPRKVLICLDDVCRMEDAKWFLFGTRGSPVGFLVVHWTPVGIWTMVGLWVPVVWVLKGSWD